MKNFSFILIIGFLIFSCSIQKRQHLSGYHITFHKKYKTEKTEEKTNPTSEHLANESTDQTNEKVEVQEKKGTLINDLVTEDDTYFYVNLTELKPKSKTQTTKINTHNNIKKSILLRDLKFKKSIERKHKKANESEPEERNSNLALTGFILSLAFLILGPLGIITSIIALVLCSNALRRMGPDAKYRELARAGKIVSIVTLSIVLLLVILTILWIYLLFMSGGY